VAALALLGVWRLAMRVVGVPSVAFWTAVLTGIYPIWFAQSSLAHADIFAAACTIWGLVCILPARGALSANECNPRLAFAWFAAAALSKETAIAIPLTLAAIRLVEGLRAAAPERLRLWREAAWLGACVVPLACWYGFHYAKTGFLFGNPEYLRYNAQTTMEPLRILAAFVHRILHLTAHMNLFMPVGIACAALILDPRTDAAGNERVAIDRTVLRTIFVLLLVNAIEFSVLGGALLTRYLLPMYPLVLLLAVTTLYRRVPYWQALTAISAAAFVAGIFINPPYGFAPEDNITYARVARMHLAGIAQLRKLAPDSTVLTAWPMTDELTRPELGYVKQPWEVERIEDFTEGQIARAADEPEKYSSALVFSTKYDPPSPLLSLGAKSEAIEERLGEQYFGQHHDMAPETIAHRLGGTLLWKSEQQGMWIALIKFDRQFEAMAGR
jgi:hypothetical protein